MNSRRVHVALIVPATNTVMEPDVHRRAQPDWAISTWRLPLESVTAEAEHRMLREELPRVSEQLKITRPDVVVFGCTSAGSLGGLEHDRELALRLERETGADAVTVVGSMRRSLDVVQPRRVAVLTPYQDELTRSVAECVTEAGFEVAAARGMGIVDNGEIGDVTASAIIDFARSELAGAEADCVFLSCTNWRAIDALEPLEKDLGIPVLSSNQVTIEGIRRASSAVPVVVGDGGSET